MLRPTKHSNPDRTALSVSVLLLARLRSKRSEHYSTLRAYTKKAVAGGEFLFLPALNLLFLLGLVEYRAKTDTFEYVGP